MRSAPPSWWCLLAGIAWLASVAAASAQPMEVKWTTYLRAGPGQQFAALDEIEAKTVLDVAGCDGGWCRVTIRGRPAYVDATMFSRPDIHARPDATSPRGDCFLAPRNGSGESVRYCSR